MITDIHFLLYSKDAKADRLFFREHSASDRPDAQRVFESAIPSRWRGMLNGKNPRTGVNERA